VRGARVCTRTEEACGQGRRGGGDALRGLVLLGAPRRIGGVEVQQGMNVFGEGLPPTPRPQRSGTHMRRMPPGAPVSGTPHSAHGTAAPFTGRPARVTGRARAQPAGGALTRSLYHSSNFSSAMLRHTVPPLASPLASLLSLSSREFVGRLNAFFPLQRLCSSRSHPLSPSSTHSPPMAQSEVGSIFEDSASSGLTARAARRAAPPSTGTPCGVSAEAACHSWRRWHAYTPAKKYFCDREGCGYFKKCWPKCAAADTTCNGCHVVGHKRWATKQEFGVFKKEHGFE